MELRDTTLISPCDYTSIIFNFQLLFYLMMSAPNQVYYDVPSPILFSVAGIERSPEKEVP